MTTAKFNLRKWQHFLALGFGSGLSPKAPGTAGTLAAIPLVWLLSFCSWPVYLSVVVAGSLLGIYVCGKAATDAGVHDHGAIVWDEVIGFAITMLFVPVNAVTLFVGFLLFRLFDIVKPWPISVLDRKVHGGLGIMLDDILAGVAACIVLQLFVHYVY